MPTSRLALAPLLAAALAAHGLAQPAPGVLFHASFDILPGQTPAPAEAVAPGKPGAYPAAAFAQGAALPTNVKAVTAAPDGRFGGAALATASKTILSFDALDNLHARRGSLALWVRLDTAGQNWKGADGVLLYVNALQSGGGEPGGRPFLLVRVHDGGQTMSFRSQDSAGQRVSLNWNSAWPPGVWRHLAVTWDLAVGWAIYLDARQVAASPNTADKHHTLALDNLSLASMAYASWQVAQPVQAALDELWVFDYVLAQEQVATLMDRNEPPPARPGLSANAAQAGHEWLRRLHNLDDPAIPQFTAGALVARAAPITRVFAQRVQIAHPVDGRPETVWPLKYKGCSQNSAALDIELADPSRVNYVRALGDVAGQLQAGGASLLAFPGGPNVQRVRVANASPAAAFRFERQSGQLHELDLYELTHASELSLPPGATTLRLHPAVPSPAGPPSAAGAAPAAPQPVQAWNALHVLTDPLAQDTPIGGFALDLRLRDFHGPATLVVQIHDPNLRGRRVADFDLRFQGNGGDQPLALLLDGRPLLAPQGRRLLVTLLFDKPGALICGPEGSRLGLLPLRPEQRPACIAVLSRLLCDQFLFMSEPAPWRGMGSNPNTQFKGVGQIFDLCDLLLRFDPSNEAAASILSWMMRWRDKWDKTAFADLLDPLADLQLPSDPDPGPEWAKAGRQALKALRRHVDWWSLERATETGELGSNYEDDTDLVNDYINFSLIGDPGGRLREGYRRLADYCWRNHLDNGLSKRLMDHLHAFEEGTNIQHGLSILDYGNPEAIERLMIISRAYDTLLTRQTPQGRVFASAFYSASKTGAPLPNPEAGWILVFQPGRYLTWYNANPRVQQVLVEWLDTWAACAEAFADQRDPRGPDGALHHLFWACEMTGQERYRHVVAQRLRRGGAFGRMEWPAWRRLAPDPETDAAILKSGRGAAWLRHKLTGDRAELIRGLQASTLHMSKYLPVHTWVGQSADRVAIPQEAMASMFLGGCADVAKRQGYHYHSVSWLGADDDVARFVVEDTPRHLKVLLYSFHDQPQDASMRVWRLAPGRYRVRAGADAGGEKIGQPVLDAEMNLERCSPISLRLPPKQVFIVECDLVERSPLDIRLRPDLAAGPSDIARDGATLKVTIHNIGGAPSPASVAALLDGDRVVARQPIPPLPAPLDLQPQTTTLTFNAPFSGRLVLCLDPEDAIREITKHNNRLPIP